MPNILLTMEMSAGRQAWTESHYVIGATSIEGATLPALSLTQKRAALLGKYAEMDVIRLSERNPLGRVFTVDFSFPSSGSWPATTVKGKWSTDIANVALLLKMETPGRPKLLYLAGVPDIVVAVDPTDVLAYNPDPTFSPLVQAYIDALVSAFGYARRQNGPGQAVKKIGTDAGFPGMVYVQTGVAIGADVGDNVQVKGFRRSNLRSRSINGIWQVADVQTISGPPTVTNYFLRNSGGVDPLNFTKNGTVAVQSYAVTAYQSGEVAKVVTRRRGGSIGLPRGRSKIRA